jgi:hypothetical protein
VELFVEDVVPEEVDVDAVSDELSETRSYSTAI